MRLPDWIAVVPVDGLGFHVSELLTVFETWQATPAFARTGGR